VTVPASVKGSLSLVCPLATRTRTLGFFVGVTGEALIPDTLLKLVSLILLNCANTLESAELYRRLADHNRDLERLVGERTRALNQANLDLQARNEELQRSLAEIETLRGILPMCSYCKKIRDDAGYWGEVDRYIAQHSDAQVSHGVCPECMEKFFPDFV
jgi:hypothetical protein